MNTYNLITIKESTINDSSFSTTTYQIPVTSGGTSVTDYGDKNRIWINNQLIVFDTQEEYDEWISQNL